MTDYRNFNVIYADADEKYVKNIVLYGETSNDYICRAEACEEADQIDKDTLMDLLKKGVLISYDGAFYTPYSFKETGGVVEVHFVTTIGASSSAEVVLYSKEHTGD